MATEEAAQAAQVPPELIRLFVAPEPQSTEFHEVTPAQLDQYLQESKSKKSGTRRRNRYHHLAVVARIENDTTEEELQRLIQSEVRTLLVQMWSNTPTELDEIFKKINSTLEKHYFENTFRLPINVAMEISAELLIIGRMRNNAKIHLEEGHILVLTTNEDYKYCGFKEIVFVINLWRYMSVLKLGDIVRINGGQIVGKVVKCGCMRPTTIAITKPGILSSYLSVEIPYYIEAKQLEEKDIEVINQAINFGIGVLVLPKLRGIDYLNAVRAYVDPNIIIVGSINLDYIDSKFIDLSDHLMVLDAVWIEDLFAMNKERRISTLITRCDALEKPIIGTIPLKTCNDFKRLENNHRVKQLDCLLIEKSPLRNKFPLIAKKLLPVCRRQIDVPPLECVSCKEGIVNFVLRTIYTVPCQAILVSNNCQKAALAFSVPSIYCPVIVVVPSDEKARTLNLYRNIMTVVNQNDEVALEFGIAFGRRHGILTTGDFIIAVSDSLDESGQVMVNLRAYYIPPITEEL